jgi:hypothetical protein
VKVCCRNGIHIYVSCAIVSLRVCNRCNSRTYCTCTTGTVPSSRNRLNMVSLHPEENQEKWCVMAFLTGNCTVVSDFEGHCMLDKYDVDWTVQFSASCCGHLCSVSQWDWLSWQVFRVFLHLFKQNIVSYYMQLVHVCFHLNSFEFIIMFVLFSINSSEVLLNQD